jgi:transcriptional antiterminator RfaH
MNVSIENVYNNPRWYVIHTKPKQEDRASQNLAAWQIETFSPKIKQLAYNPFNDGQGFITKPLFSRYIFARFAADKLLPKVTFTRGVESVVAFGGSPTAIDEEIIQLLQSRVGKDGLIKIGEEFKAGDRVVIQEGAFRDIVGIFERELSDHDRVSILLTTLSYQARVVVARDSLKRARW